MVENTHVTRSTHQTTGIIRLTVPRSEIQQVMGPGITELMDTVRAQGLEPVGPWYSHHLRMHPDVFDFEIGVPVASPVHPAGRVEPGQLRATAVARAVHCGGYEGLGEAWGELDAWIAAQGLTPDADLWESYDVGPESGPDASGYRTTLTRPLLG